MQTLPMKRVNGLYWWSAGNKCASALTGFIGFNHRKTQFLLDTNIVIGLLKQGLAILLKAITIAPALTVNIQEAEGDLSNKISPNPSLSKRGAE